MPSLQIIEDRGTIRSAQRQFERMLRNTGRATRQAIRIGFSHTERDGPDKGWVSQYGIWWVHDVYPTRYWNAFGTLPLNRKSTNATWVQINPPREGINSGIAGVFARGKDGGVYILHRGKFGGNSTGGTFSQRVFRHLSTRGWKIAHVPEDGTNTPMIVLGRVDDENLCERIERFVFEVKVLKLEVKPEKLVPLPRVSLPPVKGRFQPERPAHISNRHELTRRGYDKTHPEIVNALAERLQKITGRRLPAQGYCDILVQNPFCRAGKQRWVIFEVKTDSTRVSVYEAIGQLFVYACEREGHIAKVAVFPVGTADRVLDWLREIGIGCLLYSRSGEGKVTFHADLVDFLRGLGRERLPYPKGSENGPPGS